MADRPRGIVLMALGGPTSLDEVEPYLIDVRGGRPTPPGLVAEFEERYRRIGGSSPLLPVSRRQAQGLERELAGRGASARCEVGMRHWRPRIRTAVETLAADGVRDITGLCLTPYFSEWSVGGYLTALRGAVAEVAPDLPVFTVQRWNRTPALIEAFAHRVAAGRRSLADLGARDPLVLYTAHSLPGVTDPVREPYVVQLEETRSLVEARTPPGRSRLAYQSVGRREGPWLGPAVDKTVAEAARAGEKAVLIVPFGFISDNLEILYDVDIELRDQARELGLVFARTPSLNDDPRLVAALADTVTDAWAAMPDGPVDSR